MHEQLGPEYGCIPVLATADLLCVVVCVGMYVCVSECVSRVRIGWCVSYKRVVMRMYEDLCACAVCE